MKYKCHIIKTEPRVPTYFPQYYWEEDNYALFQDIKSILDKKDGGDVE